MNRRKLGGEMEKLAAETLRKAGYRILQSNYRCPAGEIDLIARHGKYLVFVEVKYRSTGESGLPEEAVDVRKQRVISRAALYYLAEHGMGEDTPCRFDVAAISLQGVQVYENAFDFQNPFCR